MWWLATVDSSPASGMAPTLSSGGKYVVSNTLSTVGDPCRYRLHVAAPTVGELIAAAGGWLADRAMAGWYVTAYIADDHDSPSLHILGVGAVDFASALDWRDPTALHTLAVTPDLYEMDMRIRTRIRHAVASGEPEVIVVGESYPSDLRRAPVPVQHLCSGAAQAFKRRALVAAGGSADVLVDREVLFSWPSACARPADCAPGWPTLVVGQQLPVAASKGGEVSALGAKSGRARSDEC
jgi:hypothetical protein